MTYSNFKEDFKNKLKDFLKKIRSVVAPAGLSHLEILQRITLGVLCVAGIYAYAIILIPKSWLSEELQAYHYPVLTQEEKLNRQYAGVLIFCRICDQNAWIVHDFSDFLRASNPENLPLYAVFWASIICTPHVVLGVFSPLLARLS